MHINQILRTIPLLDKEDAIKVHDAIEHHLGYGRNAPSRHDVCVYNLYENNVRVRLNLQRFLTTTCNMTPEDATSAITAMVKTASISFSSPYQVKAIPIGEFMYYDDAKKLIDDMKAMGVKADFKYRYDEEEDIDYRGRWHNIVA